MIERKLLAMKRSMKLVCAALLVALSIQVLAQDHVVIANYMKVKPGMEEQYLDVEMQWKAIHQETIRQGIKTGWQLWRRLYTGTEDEYEYITLEWYDNFESTFNMYPDALMDKIYPGNTREVLEKKTFASRDLVRRQVSHLIMEAQNSKPAKYIVINRMHVAEKHVNDYVTIEDEIWRPYHEVCIEAGFRTHWALWREWPFKEGQSIFNTIDGFASTDQIMSGEDLLSKVHPDMTWDEIDAKTENLRSIASVEIWELVDEVW